MSRWRGLAFALALAGAAAAGLLGPGPGPGPAAGDGPDRLVLALSWQPAFCETRPGRPECRSLDEGDRAATRLSLHGLWPGGRGTAWCGAAAALEDRRWSRLPEPGIDRETRAALAEAMPGMRSGLHRYQWAKHGSCYGADADAYFDDALALMAALDRSATGRLLAERVGGRVSAEEIRGALDRSFGAGTGARARLVCRDGLVLEIRIALAGPIGADPDIGVLARGADPLGGGCRGGRLDIAGQG